MVTALAGPAPEFIPAGARSDYLVARPREPFLACHPQITT